MTLLKKSFNNLVEVLIEVRQAYVNRHLNHPLGS
jgi:hypothetical protein